MNKAQFFARLNARVKRYQTQSRIQERNPLFIAKLFDFAWSATWYVAEYDHQTGIAFGYVTGLMEDEWGYFDVNELRQLTFRGIPRIEFDLYFRPERSKSVIKGLPKN